MFLTLWRFLGVFFSATSICVRLHTGPKSKIDTRGFEIQHKSNFRETKGRKKERKKNSLYNWDPSWRATSPCPRWGLSNTLDGTRTRKLKMILTNKYCFKVYLFESRLKNVCLLTNALTRVAVLCFFATYLTIIFVITFKREEKSD